MTILFSTKILGNNLRNSWHFLNLEKNVDKEYIKMYVMFKTEFGMFKLINFKF